LALSGAIFQRINHLGIYVSDLDMSGSLPPDCPRGLSLRDRNRVYLERRLVSRKIALTRE
jgi:hypothetical protein